MELGWFGHLSDFGQKLSEIVPISTIEVSINVNFV